MAGGLAQHSLSIGLTCLIDFPSSFRLRAVAHAPSVVTWLHAIWLPLKLVPKTHTAMVAHVRHSGPAYPQVR